MTRLPEGVVVVIKYYRHSYFRVPVTEQNFRQIVLLDVLATRLKIQPIRYYGADACLQKCTPDYLRLSEVSTILR